MRGGMRWGAGRPGWKAKTSALRSIDVRRLQREDLLRPGVSYIWQWKDDANSVQSSIEVRADDSGITVAYSRSGEKVAQRIGTLTTPCNYGGARVWFACPYCHRRVAILYLSRQVACRRCFRMTYPSQCASLVDRMWRKQAKIEARLHSGKRMTTATRARLIDELCRIEDVKDVILYGQMVRLVGYAKNSKC